MIVTTAGRTNEQMVEKARQVAEELRIPFVSRGKKSIKQMIGAHGQDCIVVGKNRLELHSRNQEEPFFFHPNSAMFRVRRLMNGEEDPFIAAAQIEAGAAILDCTLGLASDAIVASLISGASGEVIGVERNPFIAYIVKEGLATWNSGLAEMDLAMRRVNVLQGSSLDVLKKMDGSSVDCVYFDPMFEETIIESNGIKGLAGIADQQGISNELIAEALRVARKRVVMKDHFRSSRFNQFGFKVHIRKSSKFHYGVLEKN